MRINSDPIGCVIVSDRHEKTRHEGPQRRISFSKGDSQFRNGRRVRQLDFDAFAPREIPRAGEQSHLDLHVTTSFFFDGCSFFSISGIRPYDKANSLSGCSVGRGVPCSI